MIFINALAPAMIASGLAIVFGAIARHFDPSYTWDNIFMLSAGVFVGNFVMRLIFKF